MERAELEAAIARTETLPTLPSTRTRLAATLADPDCTFSGIARIIAVDQVLTAHLLHLVNATRKPDDRLITVTKAVRVAGFRALDGLVQAQPVIDLLPAAGSQMMDLQDLWRHALGVAIAAQILARQTGYADPEECYVAGLLHDIGKVALWQLFPETFAERFAGAARLHSTFYHYEVESAEASHAIAGRLLLRHWSLPARLVDAIGWHHTPQLATSEVHMVATVHLGDILARALELGSGGDPFVPAPHPRALQRLGIAPPALHEIMTAIDREYARSAALLA